MRMLEKVKSWFGIGVREQAAGLDHGHGHDHSGGGGHGHTHGVIDPSLSSSERGIWAIKWSFVILAITAALQLAVVLLSGSVALLADTIHNIGDATTAIPLWAAFVLARRKPSKTFNYGLGRVEDLAGLLIVLIILASALVAAYEAIHRLIHPQPITQLVAVGAAGIIGFIGNEAVAVFRIRVGRAMNSAALIADGYHARTDGLTSLAVVLGAVGVHFGFPLADPIVGLLITIAIFGIVWQSAKAVITRSLDGVAPDIVETIRHAAAHVEGVREIADAKARWTGHRLRAEIAVGVDPSLPVDEATALAGRVREALHEHLPPLEAVTVEFRPPGDAPAARPARSGHHHAPEGVRICSGLANGLVEIVDTEGGERLRLTLDQPVSGLAATALIRRPEGPEVLDLAPLQSDGRRYQSAIAPAEPHEFEAELRLARGAETERLPFAMHEPEGHHH